LMLALRITSAKLRHARQKVQHATALEHGTKERHAI
jgi:hypothetical protein